MSASRLRTVSNVWPPWLPGALTGQPLSPTTPQFQAHSFNHSLSTRTGKFASSTSTANNQTSTSKAETSKQQHNGSSHKPPLMSPQSQIQFQNGHLPPPSKTGPSASSGQAL
ncbi:hypothetical protein WAI453_003738 [Rhynchosporium graminicola]